MIAVTLIWYAEIHYCISSIAHSNFNSINKILGCVIAKCCWSNKVMSVSSQCNCDEITISMMCWWCNAFYLLAISLPRSWELNRYCVYPYRNPDVYLFLTWHFLWALSAFSTLEWWTLCLFGPRLLYGILKISTCAVAVYWGWVIVKLSW